MSDRAVYLYMDEASRREIGDDQGRVLLLGGYLGYANFGDILQIKSMLAWHRRTSGLQPVAVLDLASVTDAGFVARVRGYLGGAPLLFWSFLRVNADALGLQPCDELPRIAHLHVYGGGFLNRNWGSGMLDVIETIHSRAGVGHYVMSGQQVDPEIVPRLREHVRACPPLLAGGRDAESVAALTSCDVPAGDSFDDAAEGLEGMAASARSRRGRNHKASSALVHLNLSDYAGVGEDASWLDVWPARLAGLRAWLGADGNDSRLVLLQAYGDRRFDCVVDTLGVAQQLEDRFSLAEYRVVDLAWLALRLGEQSEETPAVLAEAGIAMASSYHVTLLCAFLGVPCYLDARNDYYRHKKQGLGLMQNDFQAFLQNPERIDLAPRLEARRAWLDRLADVYEQAPQVRDPCPTPTETKDASAVEAPTTLKPWWGSLRARIRQLEQAGAAANAEASRLANVWQEQHDRIEALEQERDRIWTECRRLAEGWEKQKTYIEHIERVNRDLEKERASLRAELAELRQRLGYRLLRKLGLASREHEQ